MAAVLGQDCVFIFLAPTPPLEKRVSPLLSSLGLALGFL